LSGFAGLGTVSNCAYTVGGACANIAATRTIRDIR
jgi:hypothetical protein